MSIKTTKHEALYDCPDNFFEDVTLTNEDGVSATVPGEIMKRMHIKAYELAYPTDSLDHMTPELSLALYHTSLEQRFDKMYRVRVVGTLAVEGK